MLQVKIFFTINHQLYIKTLKKLSFLKGLKKTPLLKLVRATNYLAIDVTFFLLQILYFYFYITIF
jgi:hypothetical protein